MSLTFDPIFPWTIFAVVAAASLGVAFWFYRLHMAGTSGRWRWLAMALRLAAILVCLFGAARPAAVVLKKVRQAASVVFLVDSSESMGITDEVDNASRWEVARKALEDAKKTLKACAPGLDVKVYRIDANLAEDSPEPSGPPKGKATAYGTGFEEVLKRQNGIRVASLILLGDGSSNSGPSPLAVAARLKNLQVPIYAVGFGKAVAGAGSKDLAMRTIEAGPTVFVKNELQVRGTLGVRGYAGQELEVELSVEGVAQPVATKKFRVPAGAEVVPITGLKYTPITAGEKKVTLRVKPKEGELVQGNNEISTFVTVQRGGLNVLYLQGPNFSWEPRFLTPALDAADFIQTDYKVLREPAEGDRGNLDDTDFAPGRYDIYILGDLPANFLTQKQQLLLRRAAERGAGLMMLGGRSSFGEGGWAGTPVGEILPVTLRPGEGQEEPEGGLKVLPNDRALDNYVLQIGPTRAESLRLWQQLPPIPGANRLGRPKETAVLLALGTSGETLMADLDIGKTRTLAFAGETWPWARASDESRMAHRKFWRQAILWLAHKENEGEGQVKVRLEQRRVAPGQKVDIIASARGPKGEAVADAKYEAKVEYLGPNGKAESLALYSQGPEARNAFYNAREPGDYRVTVTATRDGKELGRDSARFYVYEDDRELANPAADLTLMKDLSRLTGGESLLPEQLAKYIRSIDDKAFTNFERQQEYRLWDNWPFLLVFATLLSAEWWLRKRKGWV